MEENKKLQLAILQLETAKKALMDIKNWDDDLDDEWGDPGIRASRALNVIEKIDLKFRKNHE
jgi:hypothetical protein